MRMTLQPDLADLAPGDEAEFHVAMANDGADDVQVELDLQGLDADLWTLANPIPVIPAGQVGRTTIRVRLPEDATPGERRISVSVRDAAGTVGASAAAALRVGSNDVIAIETDPASVAGKKGAKLDTIVRNRGDETLRLRVSGRSDGASVTIRPAEFDLPPGKGARLKARIERNERSWFKERRHGLVLDVRGGTVPATTSAIFVQKPIVPPVLLRSLAVLVALAVWASATFVLFSRMSATDEVAAPVAPTDSIDPNAPPPTVLLAGDVPVEDDGTVAPPLVIAGTVEGPRDPAGTAVTIERVSFGDEGTTDGSTGKVAPLTPVAVTSGTVLDKITATTDEKGRFRVASGLVMGAFYRVTAQRSGFDLRSQVVSITEETPEIELAMSLVPGRGVMSGRIVDTEGNPVGGATIAATQGSITYRTTTASTGDAIGSWSLEGLATPSTYLITVAAVGYASQQLTVEVGGGATVAGVDAELTRDRGTIRGRITYRDAGVGAVTVALEGEVSRTTTTLTIGDLKGSFDFPNLPYGTYLLTFSAPGWLTSSREVTVTSGDVPVDVKDLLPSTAIVQGVVAQQVVDGGCDYPDPTAAAAEIGAGSCGGVGVSVIGENGVWSTTTATGDGSFRISGVPAGEYTVRFERYGYLPEFYKVVIGPGDVVTLPDDATYDVEMAAYVGPRNRVLQPLSTESVQLRLVPTTALTAGRVTGIVRDAFDVDTDFDASFPDWSGGCRDERVDVVVVGQPDAVCVLSAGGGFELLGVAAGAADLVINAPGFGTYTTTIQVSPQGETQAGLIPLTPLASLILNVTGTGDVPVQDAVVFVAPTNPNVPVFRGEADVRECIVTRADANDLWRERATVPDGHQSKVGLCGDADSAGDVSFARGLGTGSFDVILPVNGADPTDAAVLAGTVPLDHRQSSRSIDVQVGESARLDLRLRRYASIVGTIQVPNPTGTGYTNLTALDGLGAFPAMGLEDPADPDSDPEGIEFCEIYELGDSVPSGSVVGDCKPYVPTHVTPRVSFGSAAGLAPGQFRINRISPNEGTLLREYRIRIFTDDGDFERTPEAAGGIAGLAFGEERTLSAVASPGPTDIEIAVVWNDGTALVPVPGALVQVTGTAGFRTLDTPPFREELILTCPGAECESGESSEDGFTYAITPSDRETDAEGRRLADLGSAGVIEIGGVFRTGTLTVYAAAPGFDATTASVALRSAEVGDGFRLEMLPSAKPGSGTVSFTPAFTASPTSDALIGAMTATLTPAQGGTSLTSQLSPDGSGGATYSLPSVRPGRYTLRISGSGVFTSTSTVTIAPDTAASVSIGSVSVNRTVSLNVTVQECAPGDDCSTDPLTPVAGATIALQSSADNGATWSLVGTAVSCTDTNAASCVGLGIATFNDLVASAATIYRAVVPVSPKAGYRQVVGSVATLVGTGGVLSGDVTAATVRVEQFGSVTGVVRGKVAATDADSASSRLAGVTVQLTDSANTVVATATTDGSGTFTFPASARVTDGTYTVVVPATGVAASYQAQSGAPSVIVDGPDVVDLGATAVVLVANRVTVSGTVLDPSPDPDLLLPNVRVSIVGGAACPTTVDPTVSNSDCVWTDADGVFSITMIPRTSTLRFQEFELRSGVWTATDRPTLERSISPSIGQGITGLQIEKRPALGGLTGTIRVRNHPGASEGGVVGATVQVRLSSDNSLAATSTTTSNGSFAVTDLLTGTYDLTVSANGYATTTYAGVIVVANSAATVPVITLDAATRQVRVKATSGGSPLGGLAVRAEPPAGSTGLSVVAGTTDGDGLVDLDLVPGTWTLSSTNGAVGPLTVGGLSTVDHIDATGVPLTVSFDSARSLLDTSAAPLLTFVAVSGSVNGESFTGVSTGALDGVAVTVTGGSASAVTAGGTWTLFAPATAVARTLTFAAEKIGYVAGTTTVSVANSAATAAAVTLRALPGTDVAFSLTSSAGGPVSGATVVLVQGASTLTAPSVTDADGSVTFTSLAEGNYTVTVANTDGVATGASGHLAFGPVNPATGADPGTGPRPITVSSGMAPVSIVLQKLDTVLSGSVGVIGANESLATLSGATVEAVWTGASGSATVTTTLGTEEITGVSIASDRAWTVRVTPPQASTAQQSTRSIAAGGSGDLGRITLSTGERTVSGTLTGPAGRTVTITASANGFAERTVTRSVAIDVGRVTYSLPGLSADVTWRIDFTVAGTTVSRWVGPGSTPVELDQAVGADAVASIRIVVVDTAETAARTTPLTVTLRLDENTTPGSSTTTTQPLSESLAGGATTSTVTLVAGQTSAEHTFANLVKASATTNGLLEDRFSVTVTAGTGYAVDVAALATLTGLDPENQTLLVALDPAVRTVTATLLDTLGTSSTGDDVALGSRRVTLTRTIEGATSTIVGTADPSTTNLYTFSGVLPGTWSLATDGFGSVPVLVPVETAAPASSHDAGTLRLLSSTDRLDASTISATVTSIAVSGTTTVTVQLRDGNGNITTSGGRVRLFTDHGSLSSVADNNNGTYTATYTAPTAIGKATISASLDGRLLADTEVVDVVAGTADATKSTISITRATLPADGASTGTITVQLADANRNPIRTGGSTVVFTESAAQIDLTGTVTDHGDGTYSQSYEATTMTGTAEITVTVGGSAAGSVSVATTTVNAQVVNSTISAASGGAVTAGGTVAITVQLKSDASTNLASTGRAVAIRAASGTIGAITDAGGGAYTATYTPPTTAGTYTVWATLDGLALTAVAEVTVTPAAVSASASSIDVDRTAVPADGTSTATITVTLRDQYGNQLTSSSDSVTATVSGGGSLGSVAASGAPRRITFTSTTTLGVSEVAVEVGGSAIGAVTIARTPVNGVTANSTVTTAGSATAGGSAQTVTVQLAVGSANLTASGGTVTIQSSSGSVGAVTDNADGTYTAQFTPPTTAGVVNIWATLNGLALADGATVTVSPAAFSAATSTVSAATTTVVADGSATSAITITLRDAFGNAVTTAPSSASVAVASGSGSVGTVTFSGGVGTATFTAGGMAGVVRLEATVDSTVLDDVAFITLTAAASVPGAPTGLTAASISDTSIDVSWTAPSSNGGSAISDYIVEYRPSTSTTWTAVGAVSDATTETITGLTAGITYVIRVSAVNTTGTGAPSADLVVTTTTTTTT